MSQSHFVRVRSSSALKLGVCAAALVLGFAAGAQAQDAQETVTVTGFRGSIEKALAMKQSSLDATDAILAEDIAKFPDLNLSESIQRIPGVAIQRDGGEGRQISVRGLSPQFTRVRVNGLEALATVGSEDASGGTNRGRTFDFNVFASELFSSIIVHKTASADLEEGSLGATVDLRTARPLDYDGFTMAVSGQAGYNDLSEKINPRGALLISDTFGGGHFGALFSIAYSKRKILEEGSSTVRWQNQGAGSTTTSGRFGSVPGGTNCISPVTQNAACLLVNSAFVPRIPRYDLVDYDNTRLGINGSLQWQPDDDTLVSLDLLYADFKVKRNETYLESPVFSTTGGSGINDVDVLAYTIDANNSLVAGTFNDVDLRVEHRFDDLDTKFTQGTLTVEHSFSDVVKFHALGGIAQSKHRNPVQTTLTYDFANADGYQYDYTDMNHPAFNYGTANVASTTGWTLSQIRLRPQTADNKYRTIQGGLELGPWNWLTAQVGFEWKGYEFATTELRRSNGTTANLEASIPGAVAATPLSSYTTLGQLSGKGLSIPAGTPTSWIMPDLDVAADLFHLYDTTVFPLGPEPALGNNRGVKENDLGGYFQLGWDTSLWGLPFRGNIGVREMETHQTSRGYTFVSGTPVAITASQDYSDTLPSLNAILEPFDDFLIRFGLSKTMARPDLGNLTPGATVSVSGNNRTVTAGNPNLDPFRAKNVDLAFEWYFHKGGLFSVGLFYKDVDTFVQSLQESRPFTGNSFGLPDSVATAACGAVVGCSPGALWTFTAPINTPGGPVRGIELNYQQPFDMFFEDVPVLGHMGFLGNFTYVKSKVNYLNSAGAVVTSNDLTGLSRRSYNATLYYDDEIFSARVSAAYRSDYLTTIPGRNGNNVEGTKATFNLDASASYKWDDNFTISLEGINLTDEFQDQFVDTSERESVYHHTGREVFVGLRYNY